MHEWVDVGAALLERGAIIAVDGSTVTTLVFAGS